MKTKFIIKLIDNSGDYYLTSIGNKFVLRENIEPEFNSLSIRLFDSEKEAIEYIQRLSYSKAIFSVEKIITR